MAVRLIFYEKADVSNITCVLASKARNCKLNPIPQDVVLPPLSRVKYRMNDLGIRLPFSENIDTRDRMATLTTEIEELARSPPVCEGIEIFQLNKQKQKDVSNINTKTSEISSKVLTSKISEQFLEFITNDARFSCGKKCEILKSRKTRRRSSCNKTAHPVCSDTFTFIDYPTQEKLCIEEIVESKDKPIYERLNLTREELYISSVYLPRYENRIPITEKLRIARRRRLELRSDVSKSGEVETGKKLKVRTLNKHEPQNKDNQLKHLKLAGTEKVTTEDICERLWNKYMKEQDAMEMQSAINKKLEVNTRKVIKKFNTPPPTSDKSKKQKTKNINVNKSNMPTHGNNSSKNSSISPILPSSSNREEPLSDPPITERIKSRTVSPGTIPSRQSQRSTNFFYVSDFQKPDTRAPSQQSDYERRRSSLIMEHTPYRSKSPEPHITYSKESNKWQDSALIYSKNDAYLLNCKLEHGGISRRSSIKPGSEELAAYSCECPCRECISHKDGLDYIREHCFIGVEDYPPWLGKLRKSFGFLKSKRTEPHVGVVPRKVVSHFVKMDMPEISEELMRLFDHVMIRKEILTSSLGHTYTTITFTKTQG